MKLFKSLLVAPAALGLMSPLAVSASETNLNDISAYSDVDTIEFANSFNKDESNTNQLIAGGEGLVSGSSHDGGFSETTTASFSADMYIGAVDGGTSDTDDAVMGTYSFQIDLNTSFTGEDSLDISLDAGSGPEGVAEFDGNSGGDTLTVDGVSYTFPLGDKTTIIAGIDTDGSALFTTACAYGGPGNMLDDCANVNAGITGGGATVGAAYDFGSGFTAAFGAQTTESAVFTEESSDAFALNAAYTADSYGFSVTYGSVESAASTETVTKADQYTAFNAYYLPEGNLPSLSVGYEVGHLGAVGSASDEVTSFMVGLSWDEVGPGSAGLALGHSGTTEGTDELYQYEAYYSYPINDGMSITPLIFTKDASGSGVDDTTGVMVKTSFSF